jgi:putative cardiolipin synthase
MSITPLLEGEQAYAIWLQTLGSARRSIDIQTFIFSDDDVGRTIGGVLTEAANRGVVVRLLVDDFFQYIRDSDLRQLDAHERIEVRVFNPLRRSLPPMINYIVDRQDVDGRMHNKVVIVDGEKSIVGGRNVADEYFRLDQNQYFSDFDVLVQGAPVRALRSMFDEYWNDRRSKPYPRGTLDNPRFASRSKPKGETHKPEKILRITRLAPRVLSTEVSSVTFAGSGLVRSDWPHKLDRLAGDRISEAPKTLVDSISRAQRSVFIVTPYFVPGSKTASMLATLAERGVSVTVLTNSLGATNHASVHPGYVRSRKKLIAAGVRIFEHREDVTVSFTEADKVHRPRVMIHSKLTLIDERYLITGSLNIDPRSFVKNTEVVILVESRKLVAWLKAKLNNKLNSTSYKVLLNEDGNVVWKLPGEGGKAARHTEPNGHFGNALVSMLFSFVPPGFAL